MADNTDYITIQLTQGQVAIVDLQFAHLASLNWYAARKKTKMQYDKYYVRRKLPRVNGKQSTETLHARIMAEHLGRQLAAHELVDHINGDPLDNRLQNLRIATVAQNCLNKSRSGRNTSGFKGVSRVTRSDKWQAYIGINNKAHYLGSYVTPEEAHAAYCEAAKRLHGEFARFE